VLITIVDAAHDAEASLDVYLHLMAEAPQSPHCSSLLFRLVGGIRTHSDGLTPWKPVCPEYDLIHIVAESTDVLSSDRHAENEAESRKMVFKVFFTLVAWVRSRLCGT
jgi:hypothetical protein